MSRMVIPVVICAICMASALSYALSYTPTQSENFSDAAPFVPPTSTPHNTTTHTTPDNTHDRIVRGSMSHTHTYCWDQSALIEWSYNHTSAQRAMHAGFRSWSDINPHISATYTNSTTCSVPVSFLDPYDANLGYAWSDGSIQIKLVGEGCHGYCLCQYAERVIRDVISHEFGHVLGHDHTYNRTSVMHTYGMITYDSYAPNTHDTIPVRLDRHGIDASDPCSGSTHTLPE